MKQAEKGLLFDIQRFSLHDGPGIRTTIFFKGCPLNCLWCHNPESIKGEQELSFDPQKCIGCGHCLDVCSQVAIKDHPQKGKIYFQDRCEFCWQCVEECPAEALIIQGKEYSVSEVMDEVLKDVAYYNQSGGGVTLSGGEPTFQFDFCYELLTVCKSRDLHTALDTSGFVSSEKVKKLLPLIDLLLFDIKHMDEKRHQELTGVSNKIIKKNLMIANEEGTSIEVRIPVIPGYNDSQDNMNKTTDFINNLTNVSSVILLGYHKLGLSKPWEFNKIRGLKELEPPAEEELEQLKKLFIQKTNKKISFR